MKTILRGTKEFISTLIYILEESSIIASERFIILKFNEVHSKIFGRDLSLTKEGIRAMIHYCYQQYYSLEGFKFLAKNNSSLLPPTIYINFEDYLDKLIENNRARGILIRRFLVGGFNRSEIGMRRGNIYNSLLEVLLRLNELIQERINKYLGQKITIRFRDLCDNNESREIGRDTFLILSLFKLTYDVYFSKKDITNIKILNEFNEEVGELIFSNPNTLKPSISGIRIDKKYFSSFSCYSSEDIFKKFFEKKLKKEIEKYLEMVGLARGLSYEEIIELKNNIIPRCSLGYELLRHLHHLLFSS